ncbi:MAG: prepilin-type N-terminal cleavage/methylation domain-containing protein, partial [Clostridia bacterium]|nr:prepilin-type N-terminal cleavage/methylation domain-containing protein [Clostridia bacterium]
AHKWTRADYLLTDKLYCGKCGGGMVGVSGTSKTGAKHNYYYCAAQRKHLCDKKPVRQAWIEALVIDQAKRIVFDDELIDLIAENTYRYYVEQNTDTAYTDSLQAELKDVETSLANILKAIEAGIFNATTKERMDALDARKQMLAAALQSAKLKQGLSLTKERILYFLLRFREIDYEDHEAQKRLIATFINSVFVYDDKVVITFNYSGDDRTITLNEVDAGIASKGSTAVSFVPPKCAYPSSFFIWGSAYVQTAKHRRSIDRRCFAVYLKVYWKNRTLSCMIYFREYTTRVAEMIVNSDTHKNGFTLIELIVAVLVLGILAAIVIPMYTGYIEKARATSDKHALGVLNDVTRVYYAEEPSPNPFEVFGTSSDALMQTLVDTSLLSEKPEPQQKDASFIWDFDNEVWLLSGSHELSSGEITFGNGWFENAILASDFGQETDIVIPE